MSKQYKIDGGDPNAKDYVCENRMANQQETDALVKVLEGWGLEVEDYKFHLFGRLDDVHGWYLFGISREDSNREDFVVLGDCLDTMEAPYDKVLDLDEVIHFANTTGTHENIGTAYAAMEEWGVFQSPSEGLYEVLVEVDATVENERAYWDARYNEWMLAYDVMFATDMGGNEKVTIKIPAQMESNDAADREFMSAWKDECATYKVGESKERAMYKIRRAISNYLDKGITPDEDDALTESRERVEGEKVWVLTIVNKLGEISPEVHRTLEGCIEGVRKDLAAHFSKKDMDECWGETREAIERNLFWYDDLNDTKYDIAECGVNA